MSATPSPDRRKVLIVGAGIGGLTTAVALRRAGIEASVFERAPELLEVGAGISLWPNAIKVLRRLGVGEVVEDAGRAVTHAETRDLRGAILHASPVDQLAHRFGAPLVMVHRAALHAALVSALDEGTVQLDRHCVALERLEGGVRIDFADGGEATGQVVVGADGLRSVVRAMTLSDGPPRPRGLCTWRAVTTVAADLAAELAGGEWWGHGSVFGAQHLPSSQVYWYAARRAQPGELTAPGGERSALLDAFGDWPAPVPQLIASTGADDILRNQLFDRPAPDAMTSGRVALVGDAAHPMLPYLGQGACQAVEDGLALALAVAENPADVSRGVEVYQRNRLRPAAAAVVQSARMARVAHLRHPLGVAARNALLRRASDEATLTRLAPIVGGAAPTTADDTSRTRG